MSSSSWVISSYYHQIAEYDGLNFLNLGGIGTVWYRALEVHNGSLYVGGYHGLRKYSGGTNWELKPHGGVNGSVYKMATDTFNNFLYLGGGFQYVADTIQTYHIAMWDGFRWHAIGTDPGLTVADKGMAVYHGDLYICSGWFDTLTDGTDFNHIARWDGTQWNKVGDGLAYGSPVALEEFRDELYVGGAFTHVKSYYMGDSLVPIQRAYGLARWYMPDTNCNYMKPSVNALADTFYLSDGEDDVQLYTNTAYVDSWQWNFGDSGTDTVQNPLHTFTDTGTYTVSVTVTHEGCVKTAEKQVTILNPVGISSFDIQNSVFKIYPNPTDNRIIIETQISQSQKGEIRIFGFNGEIKTNKTIEFETNKTIEFETNKTIFDVTTWQKGNYVCCLFVGGKLVKSEKMVVQ
jgi:hypothetical protein